MTFKLSTRSLDNMKLLHPRMVAVVNGAITITEQDFIVWDRAARTAAEQNVLFKRGVTQMDGYRKKSNHQVKDDGFGWAVDIWPYVPGRPMGELMNDPKVWDLIYPIAFAMARAALDEGIRLRWGGNWYECLNDYGTSTEACAEAVQRYKRDHPGPDFIDGPHFEMLAA